MLRPLSRCAVLALSAAAIAAAQTAAKPEFDVVSIKPSTPPEPGRGYTVGCNGGPGTKDPGMIRCTNMDLGNLITRAYDIPHYLLTAPDSLRDQRFEITAKIPEGTSKEDFNAMLRNMLSERFKLTVHHESKEVPKYDMVVGKGGPKLKEAVDEPPKPPQDSSRPPAPGAPRFRTDSEGYPIIEHGSGSGMIMTNGKARLFHPKCTMDDFAKQVAGQVGKPVTNETGISGKYDIELYWSSGGPRVAPAAPAGGDAPPLASAPEDSGPTFEKAVLDQLGLRLESKKGPVDFLVVDHFDKLPTDN